MAPPSCSPRRASPWLAFIAGPLCRPLLSLVMGLICIRLSKLYFGMLQISLGSLVWAIVYRWYSFTGGDDGIHGIPVPDIISSTNGAYYFTLIVTGRLASRHVQDHPVSLRERPPGHPGQPGPQRDDRGQRQAPPARRPRHLPAFSRALPGCSSWWSTTTVFPDMLFWTLSMEIMIMCLLGGWFTFLGPMLGAAIIVLLRTFVSTYTDYWALVLGIILMLVIFFLPDGILGYVEEQFKKKAQ